MLKNNVCALYAICASLLVIHELQSQPLNTVTGVINSSSFNYPYAIAITPDGTKAYVANFGDPSSLSDPGSIDVVDLITMIVTPVSDPYTLIDKPTDLAIYGDTVYVVNSGSLHAVPSTCSPAVGSIGTIDIHYNTVTGTVSDPYMAINTPNSIAVNPTTGYAYVTNYCGGGDGYGSIAIVNLATNTITELISSNSQPVSIAINAATQTAYTTNWFDASGSFAGSIGIIDLNTNTIVGELSDASVDTDSSPHAIAVYPSTNSVYMTNQDPDLIITVTDNMLTPYDYISSLLFAAPYTIAINGDFAYVTNASNNTISIIDLTTNEVIGSVIDPLNSLNDPVAFAFSPDGSTGYIVNFAANPSINASNIKTHTRSSGSGNGSISIMGPITPPSILPPSSVSGCRTCNVFLLQTDLINNITWTAPEYGDAPVSYNIYRDQALTQLVATVSANGTLQYYDHDRQPNVIYSYYITSIDDYGNQSTAASVTVTQPC